MEIYPPHISSTPAPPPASASAPPLAIPLPKPRRRRRPRRRAAACIPPSARSEADDRRREADHEANERAARVAEGAAADGREQDQRDLPRGRLEHVLFHRRALGPERAAVRVRAAREGRGRVGVPGLRRGARARAGRQDRGSARVAGRREPVSSRSPASSRIAAPPAAASASKSGCGSSFSTA